MDKVERTNEHWVSKLPGPMGVVRLFYRRLNRLLISSVGMKVIPADFLAVSKNGMSHLLYFERLLSSLKDVPGDIVECGVSSGTSFAILCILVRHNGIKRHIWGFDTFAGLPAPGDDDLSSPASIAEKGLYRASPEMVKSTLRVSGVDEDMIKGQITLVKGLFSQTLSKHSGSSIALLHIDADLYESYNTALTELWPKVAPGGIVAFDEYEKQDTWPGAREAIDNYFSDKAANVKICSDPGINKYYAVKLK